MVVSVFPVSRSAIGKERVVVTPGSLGWESNCITTCAIRSGMRWEHSCSLSRQICMRLVYIRGVFGGSGQKDWKFLGVFTALFEAP